MIIPALRQRLHAGVSNHALLAGPATFLAIGTWIMQFVSMQAAPLPPDTVNLVLPTIISFPICALVVRIGAEAPASHVHDLRLSCRPPDQARPSLNRLSSRTSFDCPF